MVGASWDMGRIRTDGMIRGSHDGMLSPSTLWTQSREFLPHTYPKPTPNLHSGLKDIYLRHNAVQKATPEVRSWVHIPISPGPASGMRDVASAIPPTSPSSTGPWAASYGWECGTRVRRVGLQSLAVRRKTDACPSRLQMREGGEIYFNRPAHHLRSAPSH